MGKQQTYHLVQPLSDKEAKLFLTLESGDQLSGLIGAFSDSARIDPLALTGSIHNLIQPELSGTQTETVFNIEAILNERAVGYFKPLVEEFSAFKDRYNKSVDFSDGKPWKYFDFIRRIVNYYNSNTTGDLKNHLLSLGHRLNQLDTEFSELKVLVGHLNVINQTNRALKINYNKAKTANDIGTMTQLELEIRLRRRANSIEDYRVYQMMHRIKNAVHELRAIQNEFLALVANNSAVSLKMSDKALTIHRSELKKNTHDIDELPVLSEKPNEREQALASIQSALQLPVGMQFYTDLKKLEDQIKQEFDYSLNALKILPHRQLQDEEGNILSYEESKSVNFKSEHLIMQDIKQREGKMQSFIADKRQYLLNEELNIKNIQGKLYFHQKVADAIYYYSPKFLWQWVRNLIGSPKAKVLRERAASLQTQLDVLDGYEARIKQVFNHKVADALIAHNATQLDTVLVNGVKPFIFYRKHFKPRLQAARRDLTALIKAQSSKKLMEAMRVRFNLATPVMTAEARTALALEIKDIQQQIAVLEQGQTDYFVRKVQVLIEQNNTDDAKVLASQIEAWKQDETQNHTVQFLAEKLLMLTDLSRSTPNNFEEFVNASEFGLAHLNKDAVPEKAEFFTYLMLLTAINKLPKGEAFTQHATNVLVKLVKSVQTMQYRVFLMEKLAAVLRNFDFDERTKNHAALSQALRANNSPQLVSIQMLDALNHKIEEIEKTIIPRIKGFAEQMKLIKETKNFKAVEIEFNYLNQYAKDAVVNRNRVHFAHQADQVLKYIIQMNLALLKRIECKQRANKKVLMLFLQAKSNLRHYLSHKTDQEVASLGFNKDKVLAEVDASRIALSARFNSNSKAKERFESILEDIKRLAESQTFHSEQVVLVHKVNQDLRGSIYDSNVSAADKQKLLKAVVNMLKKRINASSADRQICIDSLELLLLEYSALDISTQKSYGGTPMFEITSVLAETLEKTIKKVLFEARAELKNQQNQQQELARTADYEQLVQTQDHSAVKAAPPPLPSFFTTPSYCESKLRC